MLEKYPRRKLLNFDTNIKKFVPKGPTENKSLLKLMLKLIKLAQNRHWAIECTTDD